MNNINVGIVQMVSGTDVAENIQSMQRLVRQAAAAGAQWVVLPEYWPIMGKNDTDKVAVAETFGDGVLQSALKTLAAELGIVLFGGTIPLQSTDKTKV
ncbi:MAG: carbon-nitrogen hydrolase family protein, partial [Snodgrassella sp.]|nr:carbon-nitrogen hydrolase family protein [Snodgrassella sp.]